MYVSTRDPSALYPAYDALTRQHCPAGGFYTAQTLPRIDLEQLKKLSVNEGIALALSKLFALQLSGRDIDLAIGKAPVRLVCMNHRITVAESWHNLDWDFSRMVKNIAALLKGTRDTEQPESIWAQIAVRIAVLCGACTQLLRELPPHSKFDISVPSGDFSEVMSAWYAREMGLPVENILICCNENNNLWELIHHGELRTGRSVISTSTPACDSAAPALLELLIFACGGEGEVARYLECVRESRTYFPEQEMLERLRLGLRSTVIGKKRLCDTIPGAYATHGYVFGPYSALTYAGLLDYRSRTGENNHGLLLSERGALLDDGFVSDAMGITVDALHKILD